MSSTHAYPAAATAAAAVARRCRSFPHGHLETGLAGSGMADFVPACCGSVLTGCVPVGTRCVPAGSGSVQAGSGCVLAGSGCVLDVFVAHDEDEVFIG